MITKRKEKTYLSEYERDLIISMFDHRDPEETAPAARRRILRETGLSFDSIRYITNGHNCSPAPRWIENDTTREKLVNELREKRGKDRRELALFDYMRGKISRLRFEDAWNGNEI